MWFNSFGAHAEQIWEEIKEDGRYFIYFITLVIQQWIKNRKTCNNTYIRHVHYLVEVFHCCEAVLIYQIPHKCISNEYLILSCAHWYWRGLTRYHWPKCYGPELFKQTSHYWTFTVYCYYTTSFRLILISSSNYWLKTNSLQVKYSKEILWFIIFLL